MHIWEELELDDGQKMLPHENLFSSYLLKYKLWIGDWINRSCTPGNIYM